MEDGNYKSTGNIGFLPVVTVDIPNDALDFADPRSGFRHAKAAFGLPSWLNKAKPSSKLINGVALGAGLALGISTYDRAVISTETMNAAHAQIKYFQHSLVGIDALPFKSVYAVETIVGEGPCDKLIALQVMPTMDGATLYQPENLENPVDRLFNRRVSAVGACIDNQSEPPVPIAPDTAAQMRSAHYIKAVSKPPSP